MVNETRKILDPNIKMTATCVRVPVGGHSESVNIEFKNDFEFAESKSFIKKSSWL